jgi:hypothetical protein
MKRLRLIPEAAGRIDLQQPVGIQEEEIGAFYGKQEKYAESPCPLPPVFDG